MDKLSCAVLEDLMPLYLDGLLSEETRLLVEEHINSCEKCRSLYESMSKNYDSSMKKSDTAGKNALKSIKRKITLRRLASVCAAVLLVIGICMGIGYGVFIKEKYIPYEESGIYVENGYLKTANNYHRLYGFERVEDETEFIYLASTVYTDRSARDKVIEIESLDLESRTSTEYNKGDVKTYTSKAIYYVPEEYAEKLHRQTFWTTGDDSDATEKNAALTEELKSVSVLIWSADQQG